MRTKNELYQEALRTVARRRQTARAKAEDARAEAEAAVPGLRHAEEEVRVRGIRCALAGASGKDRTEAAAALVTKLEARNADRIENYSSYIPSEVPKLEDAVIISGGRYVVLCVAEDASGVREAAQKALG